MHEQGAPVDGSSTFRYVPHVLCRKVRDEVVLLDMKGDKYLGLDPVGACLMEAFQAGHDLDGAIAQVLDRFEAQPDEVRSDALELIDSMVTQGLLEPVPTSS